MKVAIVDYGAGNIQSLRFALDRLGVESVLTANPEVLRRADKVIFPGVWERLVLPWKNCVRQA